MLRGRQAALRLRGLTIEGPLDLSDCVLDTVARFCANDWQTVSKRRLAETGMGLGPGLDDRLGYLPGRAVSIFAGLLIAGTGYFAAFADCGARPGICPIDPLQHPRWDPFLYVLDLLVPLVDLGHEKTWDPVGADKAVMIGLLLSGWVFATTLIAAAGRALRRSSE